MKLPSITPPKNSKYIGYIISRNRRSEGASSLLRLVLTISCTMVVPVASPNYYTHSEIISCKLVITRGIYTKEFILR